ncbi:MAG: hypothetical protein AAF196_20865 [Planctomycetota bacterium]
MPPTPPRLQFLFLKKGPRYSYLKAAQGRFSIAMCLVPTSLTGQIVLLGMHASTAWLIGCGLAALFSFWLLLTGTRFVVDESGRVIHGPDGDEIHASDMVGLDMDTTIEAAGDGNDVWGHLDVVFENGDRVVIAQSITPHVLSKYGEGLAQSFGVTWLPSVRDAAVKGLGRSRRRQN